MANEKKIILFLVEGSTDSTTLGLVMSRLIETADIRFIVLEGDLCYRYRINPDNASQVIMRPVNNFLKRYRLKKTDIMRIVHVVDTDGAFIPPERVIYGGNENAGYQADCILTRSVSSLRARNEMKTESARTLVALSAVDGIPYSFYYFSRNVEHALHGRAETVCGREKRELSEAFENTYADHPELFVELVKSRGVAVRGSYRKTWEYIFRGINSLKRGTNIGLFFDIKDIKREVETTPTDSEEKAEA